MIALAPASASARVTTYQGAFVCDDRGTGVPVAGARVEFWKRGVDVLPGWFPGNDKLLSATRTDANGGFGFVLNTTSHDDYYVRLSLRGEGVTLKDFLVPYFAWFLDLPSRPNIEGVQDYGGQVISDYRCQTWAALTEAYDHFVEATGMAPPQGNTDVLAAAPTAGVPYALHTTLMWPSGYQPGKRPGKTETAFHEYAHTFRHSYDGGFFHWSVDAAEWEYPQQHTACKRTNRGFAFNEGWAEWWASTPGTTMGICPETTALDTVYEGNVAAALSAIERNCRVSRGDMVRVLRESPGRIHILAEYIARFDELFGRFSQSPDCPRSLDQVKVSEVLDRQSKRVPLYRQTIRGTRLEIKKLNGAIFGIGRQIGGSLGKPLVPCKSRPCPTQVERAVKPILLDGQRAQLRLVRKSLAFQTNVKSLRRVWKLGARSYLKFRARNVEALRTGSLRIARSTARRALTAAIKVGGRRDPLVKFLRAGVGRVKVRAGLIPVLGGQVRRVVLTPGGIVPVYVGDPLPPEPAEPEPEPGSPEPEPGSPEPAPSEPPAAKADLVIDEIFLTNADGWTWNVRVRNAGPGASPATVTKLTHYQGEVNQQVPVDVLLDTPALAPGETVVVQTECPYGSLADATAVADATGIVEEVDETNNSRTYTGGGTAGRCRYP